MSEKHTESSDKQLYSLVKIIPSRWIGTCESFCKIILSLSHPHQPATRKINIQKDNAVVFQSSQVLRVISIMHMITSWLHELLLQNKSRKYQCAEKQIAAPDPKDLFIA